MGTCIARVALAVLTLGVPVARPACAQVGPDANVYVYVYGRPDPDRYTYSRPRRPPPPDDDDRPYRSPPPPFDDEDRPRFRRRHRDEPPRWGDSVCVTPRGTCMTPSGPPDAPCGCEIPGFGYRRGQIAD